MFKWQLEEADEQAHVAFLPGDGRWEIGAWERHNFSGPTGKWAWAVYRMEIEVDFGESKDEASAKAAAEVSYINMVIQTMEFNKEGSN